MEGDEGCPLSLSFLHLENGPEEGVEILELGCQPYDLKETEKTTMEV